MLPFTSPSGPSSSSRAWARTSTRAFPTVTTSSRPPSSSWSGLPLLLLLSLVSDTARKLLPLRPAPGPPAGPVPARPGGSLHPMTDSRASTSTDPSTLHRLPYTVEPHRYDLRLAPDLDAATFTGDVTIEATAHESLTTIRLHGAELAVTSASVLVDGSIVAATAALDETSEQILLTLSSPVRPGPLSLTLSFTGILNEKLHGFYRSTYTDSSGLDHVLATTQFEATDARRAFPCFDEPDRKAVFAITLDIAPGLAAYSNAPQISDESLPSGLRRLRFADTMVMSTYIVAFVVGDLVATDPLDVAGVPVRIVHVPGKQDLTSFALETAAHALTFFTDWFGIP